jgi:hypothetical protein
VTTEEKLIALADAVLEADRIIALMPEMVPSGRIKLVLVPIEGAPVLAKALKLVLEQRDMPDYPTAAEVRRYDQIRNELDALVKERE